MRVLVLFALINLIACSSGNDQQIRIITTTEEPQFELIDIISNTLGDQLGLSMSTIVGDNSYASVDSLLNDRADIAIIENFTSYMSGVKTIMPLYEQILHVFYHQDIQASSFKELCEGKRLYLGEQGSATFMLMNKLFVAFDVDTSLVDFTDQVFEEVDVFCAFTHIIRKEDLSGMEEFRLFSFDKVDHIGKGSIIDGVSIRNPYLSSFVLPNQIYNEINPNPVLTLSSVAVLVGREDLERNLVYDIVKTLRSNRLQPDREGVISLLDFNDSYNLHNLNYPLHAGSMDYIDRHQPSFLEQYAEVISVIISLIIAFGSAIFTFNGWNKQRKKNRVDKFYAKILEIKALAENSNNAVDIMQLVSQVQLTQNKAFELLMNEKLVADESFRIFVELSKDTIHSLEAKLGRFEKELSEV